MDELLDLLYFSVVDDTAADVLPSELARDLGGHSCTVFVFDPATGKPQGRLLTDHPAEMQQRYVEHYHALDPWRRPVLTELGRAVTGAELLPEQLLARTEFYNEFGKKGEMFHLLAAAVPIGPGRLVALTTHRAERAADFDGDEVARLDRLLPHLRRATQMRALLEGRPVPLASRVVPVMLAAMGQATAVCDGHGRALFLNDAAAAAKVAGTPIIQGSPSALFVTMPDPAAMRAFLLMAADAARGGAGGCLRVQGGFVLVAPLPGNFAELGIEPGSVLVTMKLADAEAMAERATRFFGLTPAEAAVSAAIATGSSPEEVATTRSVKVGTIRTLLRRALDKTDSANLRHLTALMMALD